MIIAPSLDVGVCHKEHGQDDDNNIPARENQSIVSFSISVNQGKREHLRKCSRHFTHLLGGIPRRERDHGRNLQKADLQSISRTNLHAAISSSAKRALQRGIQ